MGFLDDVMRIIFGKEETEKVMIPQKKTDDSMDRGIYSPMGGEEKMKKAEDKEDKMKKEEMEKRKKEWPSIKDQIYSTYRIPVADDGKIFAEQYCGKALDNLSVFFITDERVVKQRYIEGGDKAIKEFADNLEKHAFVGGPVSATLLRRLLSLKKAKEDGSVIDTEIDIDGFTPNGKIEFTLKEVDLDGQIIPPRKKFSPRCEMTATPTEGFHVGPFVAYSELYYCTKEEMEQMVDSKMGGGMGMGGEMKEESKMGMDKGMKEEGKMGKGIKMDDSDKDICPHAIKKDSYCSRCNGDIVIKPSKKCIGIYLDITGSMAGNKIDMAKKAVERVLQNIPVDSNIDIGLTVFSTDLNDYYSDIIPYGNKFTQEIKDMAISKVKMLKAGGGTPLYQAINKFMDETWSNGALDNDKIFFPYTYLIIVSDGEENQSRLGDIVYNGKRNNDGFFAKLRAYRDSGIITEIIPFAYGEGRSIQLINDLKDISGKSLINETDPSNINEILVGTIDSILYGADNLRMMGIPVSGKQGKQQKMTMSGTMERKEMKRKEMGGGMGGM